MVSHQYTEATMCFESTSLTKDVKKGCLQINEKMNKVKTKRMVDNVCMCNTYTTNFFEQPVGKEFCLPFTGLSNYFQIKISVYGSL